MKNILIPTNFSEEQNNTIEYAIQLSMFYNCKLTLVNAVTPVYAESPQLAYMQNSRGSAVETIEMQEIKIDAAEKYFRELIDKFKTNFDSLPEISTNIEIGLEHSVISKMVKQENIDFVLLTGYNNNNFLDFFNDERMDVVENVNIPVLFVPPMSTFKGFNRAVYATDYKKEDIKSMNQLVELCRPFNGDIYGIHISDEPSLEELAKEEGFEKILKQRIDYDNIEIYSFRQENVSNGVLKFAEEANSDLIAVLREDKSFFKRIFENDKAKKIARKTDLPVLVFNE